MHLPAVATALPAGMPSSKPMAAWQAGNDNVKFKIISIILIFAF